VRRAAALLVGALLLGLPAAPAAARAESPSLFGVVAQTNPGDAEFETMSEGGVATYRWLVSWPALQREAGAPSDWSTTDRVVEQLARHGIEPFPVVFGSPCFAVDCGAVPRHLANAQPPLGSSRARAAWTGFLGSLVDRYGPGGSFWSENPTLSGPITTWEIWNEPNSPRFYPPRPSAKGYAELLAVSAEAIRERDPNARIVLGGLAGQPESPSAIKLPRYLDQLYEAGAGRSVDAVAVHPYAPDLAGIEDQMDALLRVMEKHGEAATPVWINEIGWGTSPSGEGRLVETVDGQAKRLEEVFELALERKEKWNLAGLMWFSWRDTPAGAQVCDWCGTSGLFDRELRARPAWASFAEASGGTPASPGESGFPVPVIVAIAAAGAIAGLGGAWLWRRRKRRSDRGSL
jgi:polysaccharide biosynthesis protein PslG